ncbi:MAG: hypothetical protein AB1696_28710 [Planctomycetota bacterium]
MRRWPRIVAVMLAAVTVACPWLQVAGLAEPKFGDSDDAKECYLLASEQAALSSQTRGAEPRQGYALHGHIVLLNIALRWPHLCNGYADRSGHSSSSIPLFILHRHLTI